MTQATVARGSTKGSALTEEQLRMLAEGADGAAGEEPVDELEEGPEQPSEAAGEGSPEWCPLPEPFAPPRGRQLIFLRFRAAWTDSPSDGDRTCVLWNLTEADEKLAIRRTRGDAAQTLNELVKQSIRVVDGHLADWTGREGPGSVSRFWRDIGARCRAKVREQYVGAHTMGVEESADFFTNCVAVRTSAG